MKINVKTKHSIYDINIEKGILSRVTEFVSLDRKVIIVTDSLVPKEYSETVAFQCLNGYIYTVESGESSKSMANFEKILTFMLSKNFSRKDLVISVGGGVCGDLAGFVATSYMRGIDFVNIPTTILSQVDSSIGGKVAINLAGTKNTVGAFYQPQAVLIDPNTLNTLDNRQKSNGMAELIKHALIRDKILFEKLKTEDVYCNIEEYIYESLLIKKAIVEADERELGIRKLLNFGHTIGHAIESYYSFENFLHGECVSLGMLMIVSDERIKNEIKLVLEKFNLPTEVDYDEAKILELISYDKKSVGSEIDIVLLEQIGKGYIKRIDIASIGSFL